MTPSQGLGTEGPRVDRSSGLGRADDALAAAADWTWETDETMVFVRLSPTSPEMAAGMPDGVVGLNLEDLLLRHRAGEAERMEQIQILSAHAAFRDFRLRLWDLGAGRMRHFLLSGRPVLDRSGGFLGYCGVGVDVTSRLDRDMGEGRFRSLFEHAALGIALVRPGGRITLVNPAMTALFGYSADELTCLGMIELTHPDDRAADAVAARRLVRREVDTYSRENRYLRKGGEAFWARLTVSLTPGDEDRPFAVVMIEDIDDRKRAETNLSLFGKVMDASHEAVAILSPSGHILYANHAYGRLFGREPLAVAGTHYREYFPAESHATLDAEVAPALLRGESWEGVLDAHDHTGRRFPLWQRAGVARDEAGKVCFFFAFMHDHSAQQTFEDELFDAKEAAEEANVAKTRFLAAASHDLRQPLQALAMFVAVLAGRATDGDQAALVRRIQDSVTALEGLLNSLLDVSKLEAGLVIPHENDFAVAAMMERLASEFEPLCTADGLALTVVPTRLAVHSDPSLLERILRNLLNNAVRYTRTGRILFGCRRHGKMLRFEVWDTGIGIPAGELKNIFREFHQVGNPGRDRRQGLGLGLAIVERLCALLNHRIDLSSAEGKGSMFAVEVPLVLRHQPPTRPRQLQLGLAARGATVVAIDDEPDVLESLRLLLESWGHVVLAATGADDALRRLGSLGREPDLIVADYRLENGETGGQAIARITVHLRQTVPAIILTGDTAPERLREVRALGYSLLHKPVQPDALRAAIEDALAKGSRARRRAERSHPAARKANGG